MYGRYISAPLPFLGAFDKSPYISTSNSFGEVDDKAIELVQDAYLCCSDQLPPTSHMGDIWICNICDRVWAVPSENRSWTLTKFKLVEPAERDLLALGSYRWWVLSLISAGITVLGMFVVFFVLIGIDAPHAVYISFGVGALGVLVTSLVITKWHKLLNQYKLSLCE